MKTTGDNLFLVYARAADSLTALTGELPGAQRVVRCPSVYDLFAALTEARPAVLITRPLMLAQPHLAAYLRQHPNLRLIVWVSPGDSPFRHDGLSVVAVSSRDELAAAVASMSAAFAPQATCDEKQALSSGKFDPSDYRLSDEERNALLGAR